MYNVVFHFFLSRCARTRKKNKENGIPNPHLFSMPEVKRHHCNTVTKKWVKITERFSLRISELFNLQRNKLNRKDWDLMCKDKVCSLHFNVKWINALSRSHILDADLYENVYFSMTFCCGCIQNTYSFHFICYKITPTSFWIFWVYFTLIAVYLFVRDIYWVYTCYLAILHIFK